jgi:hypothetical protein
LALGRDAPLGQLAHALDLRLGDRDQLLDLGRALGDGDPLLGRNRALDPGENVPPSNRLAHTRQPCLGRDDASPRQALHDAATVRVGDHPSPPS